MAKASQATEQEAVLGEFAFFQFLWTFYRQNRGAIRREYRDLTRKFLDFNDPDHNPRAFLRTPQFEALEVYIFLKEFLGNSRVEEIFKDWFDRAGKFALREEGGIANRQGQVSLFENVTRDQYKVVFEAMKRNRRVYPNYIFALTMGTGKTILMATCIFYEFILANKWPKDPKYCHNALVCSPDKTVLHSLRELESFPLARVVPPEYVNFLTTHIRFHYLEEAGTSLDTLDQSRFNVIVSNVQKIILKKKHKQDSAIDSLFRATPEVFTLENVYGEAADLYGFDQPEDETELTTNQRFEKLTRLEQLGIYVDEAHHAFGADLAKDMGIGKLTDTSLRTTIDKLAAKLKSAGTQVVACFNYTGTPYVGRTVLPEVVYAYGLKDAINNLYLKNVDLKGYSNSRTAEFVKIVVDDFCDQTEGLQPEGLTPKIAFFAADIDEAVNKLKPAVEAALIERGISTSRILINVGDAKITSNDDERAFRRLDYPESEKQFIILVNKGREGWNCRSLFGVALFRKPNSKIFVLQASMRCLRSIGDAQQTGHIYLSQENLAILDEELQQNFRMTADDLKAAASDKETVQIRVNEPVKLKIRRVRRSFDLEEKVPVENADLGFNMADKAAWAELTDRYRLLETQRLELGPAKASDRVKDLSGKRSKLAYSSLMIVAEVARYLNRSPIEIDRLLSSSKQGFPSILDAVNTFNDLLYDLIIPSLFRTLYGLNPTETAEEFEVDLVKIPAEGFYSVTAAKDKIVRETDALAQPHRDKSFHLDTYCFDSNPEQILFWDLVREGRVKKLYFTGMLTHGQSDFFIQYIDPDSNTVRSYYPDFLFERDDGKMVIVEVKGDHQINTPVVQAKREFAEQMAIASGMTYEMIKGSDASAHSYQRLLH
ncbi:type III restriction endonuclease [Sphingopyxis sp. Root1497]|uniref:TnsA endonuclease N-terminal domain-containing protein n=1 Tax=Sphingopyxis sp. Root1497 TaxID=1736474 RepID=UPI0006F62D32|nr:TnsA endonuclease N-terminal domain-containing protein [Sphingopyxis sp. Root1497]KQZ64887.1 type III restriction endonuclease [Sphingopyxis sp. Root1497]